MNESACKYWRSCCCSHNDNDHCWGCGRPRNEHSDGEHMKTEEPTGTPGEEPRG